MKTAFAYWENRIAPVFDTARELLLVESEENLIVEKQRLPLTDEPPLARTLRLVNLGIETLICGAISRALQEMLQAYGIEVMCFVTGDLDEVVQAWFGGGLEQEVFAMPGCRRRGGHGWHNVRKENTMPGRGGNQGSGRGQGMGRGQGQGMGQKTGGRGRQGGPLAAGPAGLCLCPNCGHRQPHERGRPCVNLLCPQCGTALVRS